MNRLRFCVIILLGLLSGCWFSQHNSMGNGTNFAELLYSGTFGNLDLQDASATWITDHTSLEQFYTALSKHHVNGDNKALEIDFKKYGVLLLEMGQKPTGGYSIIYEPSKSNIADRQAVIHVTWNVPQDGMVTTQALTSPFLLIKVWRCDLNSIIVLDQKEQTLFELSIKSRADFILRDCVATKDKILALSLRG